MNSSYRQMHVTNFCSTYFLAGYRFTKAATMMNSTVAVHMAWPDGLPRTKQDIDIIQGLDENNPTPTTPRKIAALNWCYMYIWLGIAQDQTQWRLRFHKNVEISLCISHSESLCDRHYPPDPLDQLAVFLGKMM